MRSRFRLPMLAAPAVLLGAALALAADSSEVLVIRSSSHPTLGAGLRAFEDSCDCRVVVEQLRGEELADREAIRTRLAADPTLVVTLGPWATELVSDVDPKRWHLAGFVTAGRGYSRTRGVSESPPPERELDQLLKLTPEVKSIGILFDPRESRGAVTEVQSVAKVRRIKVQLAPVGVPSDVPRAFRTIADRVDAILLMPDRPLVASREAISYLVLGCLEENVVLYTRSEVLVKRGVLFSLVADPTSVGRSLGTIARRVLGGEQSIETSTWVWPERYELMLNRRTATTLGLSLTEELAQVEPSGDLIRVTLGAETQQVARLVPARVVKSFLVDAPVAAGVEGPGLVVMRLRLSAEGEILNKVVLSGEPPFTELALDAVSEWEFAPATRDGKPVESSLVTSVMFDHGS